MIQSLRQKLQTIENLNDKILLLTVLPTSWSVNRLANEMNCSRNLASQAKLVQEQHGMFSVLESSRNSRKISDETIQLVKSFYCYNECSRIMPGKKKFCEFERRWFKSANTKEVDFREFNRNICCF